MWRVCLLVFVLLVAAPAAAQDLCAEAEQADAGTVSTKAAVSWCYPLADVSTITEFRVYIDGALFMRVTGAVPVSVMAGNLAYFEYPLSTGSGAPKGTHNVWMTAVGNGDESAPSNIVLFKVGNVPPGKVRVK
jgi:hypothetical protein